MDHPVPGMTEDARTGSATSARAGRALSRLRWLAVMGIALTAWAWYVVLHDPVYQRSFPVLFGIAPRAPVLPTPDASVYEAKDPAAGAPLPRVGAGPEIRARSPRSRGGYLLACLGSCSSCSRLDLARLYGQARPRHVSVLAFASGEAESVRGLAAALARDGVEVPVYIDSDARLAGALNGYYPGRLYYFTPDWRLRWRERDWGIDNYLFTTGRFDRILRNTSP